MMRRIDYWAGVAVVTGALLACIVWWVDWIFLPCYLGLVSVVYKGHVAAVCLLMPAAGAYLASRTSNVWAAVWPTFAATTGYWMTWLITRYYTEGQGRMSLTEYWQFYGDTVFAAVLYLALSWAAPIVWHRLFTQPASG